jgi:hypothetical protein
LTVSEIGRAVWLYEIRPFVLTAVLISRGFRSRPIPGWPYNRDGVSSFALIALAVITVPQALALDLLFSHSATLRIASALLHLYAIVWLLALAHALQSEPHVIADGRATFRFPLLQAVTIAVTDIEAVQHVRFRPPGMARFGLGKSGIVLQLKQPVRIDRPMFARSTSNIFVAADDPRALAGALFRGREA